MSQTITDTILMVRPKHFGYNAETAENNAFQNKEGSENIGQIKKSALEEFDNMVSVLKSYDIDVIVIEDTDEPIKKDSVFPNNWFTTHADGKIVTFPMNAVSRRAERRDDIIERIENEYNFNKRYCFEYLEDENQFLEGTGSMILDRDNRIIYACISPRTDIRALEKFSVLINYSKIIFHAFDNNDQLIYHTNVMMAMGKDFVVICLDSIRDSDEHDTLVRQFSQTGKEIIDISIEQMNQFAGNMLQVKSKMGEPILIMSQAAYNSLNITQIDKLSEFTKVISIPIPTIEKYGGGSVRCMMAEIFTD
ncbi:MAG: amidinotransferase [Saprospiraceae bacterium]|nr:amidinotransferase [Saprospiraceae bacterium]NNL92002.1 amidinotransferase [Saprospiraceae bacterium]